MAATVGLSEVDEILFLWLTENIILGNTKRDHLTRGMSKGVPLVAMS
jgi:hypothetical protein